LIRPGYPKQKLGWSFKPSVAGSDPSKMGVLPRSAIPHKGPVLGRFMGYDPPKGGIFVIFPRFRKIEGLFCPNVTFVQPASKMLFLTKICTFTIEP
jgi:hypothetical protein